MPTAGRSQQGPGCAPPGGSCRRRSRFSRFWGAHDRAAYATACLRVPAGPPSQPKASEAGGRAREASGEPRIHPTPPASWHDGDSAGDGGVSHPGVAVPGWHRCPAAPCHSIPTPTPPPPSWAGKLAVARRGHLGTAAGDDACPRCQGRVVPAGAGGTVAAGTGLGSRSLRVWGDINGAGRGSVCRGMHVHACVHVCVRACAHTPPPPPGFGARVSSLTWPPAPTWFRGYFCLQPGFNSTLPVAGV